MSTPKARILIMTQIVNFIRKTLHNTGFTFDYYNAGFTNFLYTNNQIQGFVFVCKPYIPLSSLKRLETIFETENIVCAEERQINHRAVNFRDPLFNPIDRNFL